MKLATARIAAFLSSPPAELRIILVYGPDAGLVRERGLQLAKTVLPDLNDPFRVAILTGSSLAEDPTRLYDEMAAQALGGGRRLIRLQNPGEPAAGAVAKLLADLPACDSLLLIEAGDLDKRSKLRAVCDSDSPFCCAVPCYIEDAAARQRTIGDILAGAKITASRDVVAALADILPQDRGALRSELEKLAIYAGSGNSVSLQDVHACVQDAGAAELDDLVFAIGSGETRRAAQLIDRLFAEQSAPTALLRAAQRHFMRLHLARTHMDSGLSAAEAVKKLQPPVFWKNESAMAAQLRRWPSVKTEQALRRLYDAEAAVKRTGTPDTTLCAQTLLGLAA